MKYGGYESAKMPAPYLYPSEDAYRIRMDWGGQQHGQFPTLQPPPAAVFSPQEKFSTTTSTYLGVAGYGRGILAAVPKSFDTLHHLQAWLNRDIVGWRWRALEHGVHVREEAWSVGVPIGSKNIANIPEVLGHISCFANVCTA